ncbi:MAG: LysM peptidoglycan-binding domain-containing protein [Clostridiales bacterium]|jgi:hypothetical protein|nr:LysM peptidoglycan-binding domain-containing protein [Clostridiales bacterium]
MGEVILQLLRTVFLPSDSPPIYAVNNIKVDIREQQIRSDGGKTFCQGEADILIDYLSLDQGGEAGSFFRESHGLYPTPSGSPWQAMIFLPFDLLIEGELDCPPMWKLSVTDFQWLVVAPRALEMDLQLSLIGPGSQSQSCPAPAAQPWMQPPNTPLEEEINLPGQSWAVADESGQEQPREPLPPPSTGWQTQPFLAQKEDAAKVSWRYSLSDAAAVPEPPRAVSRLPEEEQPLFPERTPGRRSVGNQNPQGEGSQEYFDLTDPSWKSWGHRRADPPGVRDNPQSAETIDPALDGAIDNREKAKTDRVILEGRENMPNDEAPDWQEEKAEEKQPSKEESMNRNQDLNDTLTEKLLQGDFEETETPLKNDDRDFLEEAVPVSERHLSFKPIEPLPQPPLFTPPPAFREQAEVPIRPPLAGMPPTQAEPEPIVTEPIVPKPIVPKPIVPKPIVPKPIMPEPIVPKPIVPEPIAPEPIVPEPIVPEPIMPEPIVPEPIVPEPIMPEPIVPEPIVLEPIVLESIVSEPIVSEPIAPEPIIPESTMSGPVVSEPIVSEPQPIQKTKAEAEPQTIIEPAQECPMARRQEEIEREFNQEVLERDIQQELRADSQRRPVRESMQPGPIKPCEENNPLEPQIAADIARRKRHSMSFCRVMPGETAISLALRLGVPVDLLLAKNKLEGQEIVPGMVLRVPRV